MSNSLRHPSIRQRHQRANESLFDQYALALASAPVTLLNSEELQMIMTDILQHEMKEMSKRVAVIFAEVERVTHSISDGFKSDSDLDKGEQRALMQDLFEEEQEETLIVLKEQWQTRLDHVREESNLVYEQLMALSNHRGITREIFTQYFHEVCLALARNQNITKFDEFEAYKKLKPHRQLDTKAGDRERQQDRNGNSMSHIPVHSNLFSTLLSAGTSNNQPLLRQNTSNNQVSHHPDAVPLLPIAMAAT